jgi:4-hydroxythreonine-4-phosphate dehydrogenase
MKITSRLLRSKTRSVRGSSAKPFGLGSPRSYNQNMATLTTHMNPRPRLLITMGDVAGIGPEIIAKAWPAVLELCRPVVVGNPDWLRRAIGQLKSPVIVQEFREYFMSLGDFGTPERIPCVSASDQDLSQVQPGRVSAAAGKAAYDFLCTAIDHTLAGAADGIVTAPLHKEGLRAAGLHYPGHTEILAERTGTDRFAMLLYASTPGLARAPALASAPTLAQKHGHGQGQGRELHGLGVAHVTLHMALRDIFQHLTCEAVSEKIRLLDGVLARLMPGPSPGLKNDHWPRIGVAGLNPHAGDGGLFGDEEDRIIAPAVKTAQTEGFNATGPWPSDTLFVRACEGEFDGLVVMYHDQGHIAVKLLGGRRAVNISAGLPIVRTSVAHGTAYDIAGKGIADESSLIEATRVAARLVMSDE